MEQAHGHAVGKCFGTTIVGPRGQLVIPVEARKEMGIDVGTKLLVFSHFRGEGLIFVKVKAIEGLINMASRRIDEFAKLVRKPDTAPVDNEDDQG